jgi:hypothetical protein
MDPEQDSDHTREDEIVAVLSAARERDRAPASLRTRIEHERTRSQHSRRPQSPPRRLGRRLAGAGALAVVLALLAVSLDLLLPSHGPGVTSISQAAALAIRGPSGPPPAITRQGQGTRLGASVDEVYFPDWRKTLGWRAVGQRADELGGRRAVTVYYGRGGDLVAYTIVSTPPLPEPQSHQIQAGGLTVRALTLSGRTVVTWRRAGITCVLSAAGVNARVLASLASWSDQPGTA